MIPFARRVHEGRYRRCVAVTAAQSGKTDNILDVIGARLDQRPAPILYVGPSRDFVTDQFEPRLMALLDEAETLKSKVVRGRRMKKALKYVAGVRVRLGSAGSSSSLKSDPFALGIVDEYDEMMGNIKGQGDPLGLVEARGETYADFVTAVTSTPSLGTVETEVDPVNGLEFWKVGDPEQVESPIWRLWQSGTRHHFAWACPHCGEYFVPRHKLLKWEKGATPTRAKQTAYLECPNNGCVIENHSKAEMIAGGVQIAPGQTIEDAVAGVNDPDNGTWSCWTSGLCSPFVTFGERAERFLIAYQSGETDKLQTVMNAAFGELYSVVTNGDQPEASAVMARKIPYKKGTVPAGGLRLVMGVDVQRFSLVWVIRAFGSRGTSWLVEEGQFYGPTDKDEVWDQLQERMLTPIEGLQIERVGIDSGFRPDKKDQGNEHRVYEFCRRYAWLCAPTKGRQVQTPPYRVSKIEVKKDGKRAAYSLDLVLLSTDFFKSLVMSRLQTPLGVAGAFYVHEDVTEDYAKQVTSEVRTLKGGKPLWVRVIKDNHFLDCEAIAAAMAYSLNVQRIPEGVTRPNAEPATTDQAQDNEPSDPPNDDDRPPAPKPNRPTSFRNRFAGHGQRLNR